MTDDFDNQIGVHRLTYAAAMRLTLDIRLERLTFSVRREHAPYCGSISLPFDSFPALEQALQSLSQKYKKTLCEFLTNLVKANTGLRDPVWRDALGRFAFLLLRFSLKHKPNFEEVAHQLILWLGPDDLKTAWRERFNENLSYDQRHALLQDAKLAFTGDDDHNPSNSPAFQGVPDKKEREFYWWTVRCQYHLVAEWYRQQGHFDLGVRQVLQDASASYLQLLKDEPRRQDLDRFLMECGSGIEKEVKKVLGFRERRKDKTNQLNLAGDEALRRTFFLWLLRRYDLIGAARLLLSTFSKMDFFYVGIYVLCFFLVGFLYYVQTGESPRLNQWLQAHGLLLPVPSLWMIQSVVQLILIIAILVMTPVLFRLLMPRSLFGSLLAWLTVVVTTVPNLAQIHVHTAGGVQTLKDLCHNKSDVDLIVFGVIGSIPIIMLSLIFIAYEVTQFVNNRRKIAVRSGVAMVGLWLGSFFWSLILSLPAKYLMEGGGEANFEFDCSCHIPILFIGSSLAVLFGILIQLLWEDEAMIEPLGEPL